MLETAGGEADYVVGLAVGWHEDVLGPTRLSFFAYIDPYDPRWPGTVFGGYDAGLDVASAEDLITALTTDSAPGTSRDRYRYIHLVMVRGDVRYRDRETAARLSAVQKPAEVTLLLSGPHLCRLGQTRLTLILTEVYGRVLLVDKTFVDKLGKGVRRKATTRRCDREEGMLRYHD